MLSQKINPDILAAHIKLKNDFNLFSPSCLRIRGKKGGLHPFTMNRAQMYLHDIAERQLADRGWVRINVLKGRQQGVSTYVAGRFFHKVIHSYGVLAYIFAHKRPSAKALFDIAKRYYDELPPWIKPQVSKYNYDELYFDLLGSGYKTGSSYDKESGRGDTIQLFHGSEAAFWQNTDEIVRGIMQAIALEKGTEVFIESTSNGPNNFFHQQWLNADSGESRYINVFLPWFWQDEYSIQLPEGFELNEEEKEIKRIYEINDNQIFWRREKISELSTDGMNGEIAFRREYPFTSTEAFQQSLENSYVPNELVLRARKCFVSAEGPLVVGVDPAASDGDVDDESQSLGDRTAIIRRRGRHAFNIQYFRNNDTMAIVGALKTLIETEHPRAVFIDVGGIGHGIVDRLREMFGREIIKPVNFGSSALRKERFYNRRAEMWANMKEWFREEPCQIPDDDRLHSELISVPYDPTYCDSSGRLKLVSKTKIKGRSPDGADALALTFAQPVPSEHGSSKRVVNFGLV